MNIIPVEGPRMPVNGSTSRLPLDAASRSYDHSAWRLGSLKKTLLRSASMTTLCSVGYGSLMTRAGATSPPLIVAVFQPGGHDVAGGSSATSRHPFSRSMASSLASDRGDEGNGQMVPVAVGPPACRPPNESSSNPTVERMSLRMSLLVSGRRWHTIAVGTAKIKSIGLTIEIRACVGPRPGVVVWSFDVPLATVLHLRACCWNGRTK